MFIQKKPKIAILSIRNTYNYGGVLSCLKTAYAFCEQYFEPKVFFLGFDSEISTSLKACKFTSSVKPLSYFGMSCVEIGARWAFWEPGHYSFTLNAWKEQLKDYDYFLVVSGTPIAGHPLILLKKKFIMWIGTPYDADRSERVKQLYGIRYLIDRFAQKWMKCIEKEVLKKSSYTWAISTYAQEQFRKIAGHNKETVQRCGYPISFKTIPSLDQLKKEKIILAVGRFSDPRKNIDMLIQAFEKIHQKLPQYKLFVVGMKPAPEKLFTYASQRSYKNIVFTGQLGNADLISFYKRSSLMLITSYQEGLGIVGLEALLHGTAIVATDCGGTRDYVINDVTGYLVPINDSDQMAQRAVEVLTSKEKRLSFGLTGQSLIQDHFSIPKAYDSFKKSLEKTYPQLEDWFKICDENKVENMTNTTKNKTLESRI